MGSQINFYFTHAIADEVWFVYATATENPKAEGCHDANWFSSKLLFQAGDYG